MTDSSWLDLVLGTVALLIIFAGLLMLFQGISSMNDKEKN